jgi:two-component system CheB/CheR fusion protein
MSRYVPPSVIVNQDMEVLQFKGATGLFLEHSTGKASLNLLKMARTELTFDLRSAIHKAGKSGKPVKKTGLELRNKDITHLVSIEVLPLKPDGPEKLFLVVFEEITHSASEISATGSRDRTIKKLQEELTTLREDMRSIVEEQEASNEELQSANEEIVSSNEELQSINEELETSKEEVESANEELMTINQELLVRNEQLAEANEYAEAFFYTIREAVLVLDRELRVKTANHAFYNIFKAKKEDVEGRFFYELGNRQWDIPKLRDLLENIIPRNSQFNNYEVKHNFPEIGEKTMLLNGRRIFQKIQHQQLILLAIEDISAHKQIQHELEKRVRERTADLLQTNRELERSNSELKQFAYVASHDLQEPLRKIMTFSDRLHHQFSAQLPEKGRDFIEKITSSTQRMSKLINDLLNFSKTSPQNEPFTKTELNNIIKNVLTDFEEIIKEKQAAINIGPLPVMQAIPVQMEQLFHNLISNALKFTHKKRKPVISITTRPFDQNQLVRFPRLNPNSTYCEIIVQDNGIGFNEAYAEQIFIIFQRLYDNKDFPGTGIGLALCRKIVNNHNGELYAISKENKGAAFHIILPVNH